jgi:hypothetical protein
MASDEEILAAVRTLPEGPARYRLGKLGQA